MSLVHAPDRKSRIIAILDYWSQSAVKPLSDILFNILKGLPQDCTFNQNSPLMKLTDDDEPYYSFDLKSATDRFPMSIQKLVIEQLTDEEYSRH